MNKLAVSIVTLIAVAFSSCESNKEEKTVEATTIPTVVTAAFEQQFKSSTPEWEKEDNGYEATFKQDGKKVSVTFSETGMITETETEIVVSELPAAITEYLDKNHAGAKPEEAAKITNADGVVTYEAEVDDKDLIFDENGNLIRQETK
jgi:hypothetical protein